MWGILGHFTSGNRLSKFDYEDGLFRMGLAPIANPTRVIIKSITISIIVGVSPGGRS
jgi:hypothetical protein